MSIRLLAVALLLLIGGLTLPKIGPRMAGIFRRDAARQAVWRQAAGVADRPPAAARSIDVVLILAAALAGGAVLLGLGYLALRQTKQPRGRKSDRDERAANRG